MWYDYIASEQENYALPKLKRLIDVIFWDQQQINFKFKTLRTLDEVQTAELRNKQSQTDRNYIESGVLDPNEVAESRFGGDEYSLETNLDKEAREAGMIPSLPGGEGNENQPEDDDEEFSYTPPFNPEGAAEPEPGRGFDPNEETGRDITGVPRRAGGDMTDEAGTQFALSNELSKTSKRLQPKERALISQTMSLPMRDPIGGEPKMKGPGIPNKPRSYLPTRGNGLTAPSGFDFEKDAGSKGVQQEMPSRMDSKKKKPKKKK